MKSARIPVFIVALVAGGPAAFMVVDGVDMQTATGSAIKFPTGDVRVDAGGVSSGARGAEINTVRFDTGVNSCCFRGFNEATQ